MSKISASTNTQKDSKPQYWLKPEQIEAMRDATVRESPEYLKSRNDAIITLLADTGLRVNELRQLDIGMVDFDDGVLTVPAGIQNNTPRVAHHHLLESNLTLGQFEHSRPTFPPGGKTRKPCSRRSLMTGFRISQ